jgi:hypothetical protein
MHFVKRTSVLVATVLVALAGLLGQTGAVASVSTVGDFVTTVGTGTTTPGLPTTGCAVQTSITDTMTGALVGEDGVVVPATLAFFGNSGSTCETLNSGQGSGTVAGTFSSAPNGVTYQRTGAFEQFSGSVTVNGSSRTYLVYVCIVVWTSLNPANTNGKYCVGIWR